MTNKAQINTQVLVYILALIITAMVLVYGYSAVQKILAGNEQAEIIRFQTDLSSAISAVKDDYGSVKNIVVGVPQDYKQVCFAESDITIATIETPLSDSPDYEIIKDNVLSGLGDNVFLVPPGTESFKVANISLGTDNFRCLDIKDNKLKLRLEGTGWAVDIS